MQVAGCILWSKAIWVYQGAANTKTFTRLVGYGMKSMLPIFSTKMLINRSKANLNITILFGAVTHHLDPEIRKMLVRCIVGNENSTFLSGP